MSNATITGYIMISDDVIFLSRVLGIYADRGKPRKPDDHPIERAIQENARIKYLTT